MALLKLFRAALHFQTGFLEASSVLAVSSHVGAQFSAISLTNKRWHQSVGKLCTSVPEQLGLRTNAAFPVVGVEKMELCSEQEAGTLGVGKLCLGSDEKPGKREKSDDRHVLVGFGTTLLEMYAELCIKHLNFSE